jgi:cell division protein FtsA
MAGCEIRTVFVGIAGPYQGHERARDDNDKDREVAKRDVERVIESANAVLIPADRK